MKGVIPDCLAKLVIDKFGKDKWEEVLETAGLSKNLSFMVTQDIPDADVMKVVETTCKVLKITLQQAADAFGDYWVNDYAIKIYKSYYRKSNSAKEFLLNMDNVHKTVTENIANAHPPRFTYNWKNDKTLVMTYNSERGLIDFLVGLVKGVGNYYDENLKVMRVGNDKVQVMFP